MSCDTQRYSATTGKGRLTGRDVVSAAGADESAFGVAEREYEGRYEVRANGTGTLTLDLAPDFQPTGHFVIVDDGAAIEIIFAVEGNANAFTLRKHVAAHVLGAFLVAKAGDVEDVFVFHLRLHA